MKPSLENVSRIEPCQLDDIPAGIADRAVELAMKASLLASTLRSQTRGRIVEERERPLNPSVAPRPLGTQPPSLRQAA